MTRDQLARLLAAAIALPTSLLTAACECPHQVVLEEDDRTISAAEACAAANEMNSEQNALGTTPQTCAVLCNDDKYTYCFLDEDYWVAWSDANNNVGGGGAGGAGSGCPDHTATLTCQVTEWRGQHHSGCPIAGRRPAGLAEIGQDPTAVGRYLASSAYYEAAAVIAFERLADELRGLGASGDLLADLARAARDETRHAAVMTALAIRRGVSVEAPVLAPPEARSVEAIAVENAVEGVVNEAFAAAVALFQAHNAEDPQIRAAMRAIADDECAHAALALRIATFLDPLLDDAARARVQASLDAAVQRFADTLEEPSPEVHRLAGVPTRAQAASIHARLTRTLWQTPAKVAASPTAMAGTIATA